MTSDEAIKSNEGIKAAFNFERENFSLRLECNLPGDGLTVIFGPSGSGKTTLLRLIAGLEKSRGASVKVNAETWQANDLFKPTHQRRVGFVFQHPNLLPHLSVMGNLMFAQKRAQGGTRHHAEALIETCGIGHLLERKPEQLSGGEKQRVAIAAALVSGPSVLLMDEPISALDQTAKRDLLNFLEELKLKLAIPILYVTHSLSELARLADTLLLLENGQLSALGPANELLPRISEYLPEDELAAIITARAAERQEKWQLVRFNFDCGDIWVQDQGYEVGKRYRLKVMARDVSVSLSHHQDSSILNVLPATIGSLKDQSDGTMLLNLSVGRSSFVAKITCWSGEKLQLFAGKSVYLQIKSVALLS